jgi:glycosyltransferase involved in cell wall biosynthesis
MRVAIVHYWLLNMRGGEKVLEALCRIFPEADLFTLFYDSSCVSPSLRAHRVQVSELQPFRRWYRALLPLMPMALENFDLRGYDLVISSESGPAKGVLAPSSARHICYCHTPMRYLWDLYPAYRKEWTRSRFARALMGPLAHYLRLWDYASAARVDDFVANSGNVARRIRRAYGRESIVIPPPVEVEKCFSLPAENYYLIVSELVAYKRIDSAVRAFAAMGRRLRIVGDGPEFRALRRLAPPNIEFCGRVTEDELHHLYARCRAFLMPGEEDFGMAAVEALASGKPVIALGRGGALETVPLSEPLGGLLYQGAEPDSLIEAVRTWDAFERHVQPHALHRYAAKFSEAEFLRKMNRVLFSAATMDAEVANVRRM